MATITAEKPKRGGLTLLNKLAFGAGDLGAAIAAGVNGFYLNAFLLTVAGLPPLSVGIIFFIAQFWDAINDPIIGTLSDRTRSRFGRRRSWMLYGAVPFGLAFVLHWLVPFPADSVFTFWYYLLIAILLRTASTAVNVPYTAMTPEMTEDYDERTQLNTFRFAFSILGGLVAIVAHPIIVCSFDSVTAGHMMSAGIWGTFIVLSSLVCVAGTFELPHQVQEETESFSANYWDNLKQVFQNRPFLIVTGIYLMSWLTLQFVQQFLLLYARYWLNTEANFPFYVLILQVTAFVFLGIWTFVSARIGKKHTYVIGASIWIVAMTALFFVQPGQEAFVFVIAFFAGMGVSTAYLIPWSMLPDVVDYDELQTGKRREGIYYGLFALLQQIGISFGVFLGNLGLQMAGFVTPEVVERVCGVTETAVVAQPDSVLLTLRLIVSLVPVLILLLSIPLTLAYPISRERHAEIMSDLEEMRKNAADTAQ